MQGVEQVVVGYDHSPGSTVSIRIDDEKPYVSSAKGWSGPAAIKLFVALAASAKASFRFVRWPDQAPTDAFMQTIGITEAVDLARWAATTK